MTAVVDAGTSAPSAVGMEPTKPNLPEGNLMTCKPRFMVWSSKGRGLGRAKLDRPQFAEFRARGAKRFANHVGEVVPAFRRAVRGVEFAHGIVGATAKVVGADFAPIGRLVGIVFEVDA